MIELDWRAVDPDLDGSGDDTGKENGDSLVLERRWYVRFCPVEERSNLALCIVLYVGADGDVLILKLRDRHFGLVVTQ